MSAEDIKRALMEELTVPLPLAGRALGLGRNASYEAAKRGDIPTIDIGCKKPVPTSWLRRRLGLEREAL
jgi:hypothetical protein